MLQCNSKDEGKVLLTATTKFTKLWDLRVRRGDSNIHRFWGHRCGFKSQSHRLLPLCSWAGSLLFLSSFVSFCLWSIKWRLRYVNALHLISAKMEAIIIPSQELEDVMNMVPSNASHLNHTHTHTLLWRLSLQLRILPPRRDFKSVWSLSDFSGTHMCASGDSIWLVGKKWIVAISDRGGKSWIKSLFLPWEVALLVTLLIFFFSGWAG